MGIKRLYPNIKKVFIKQKLSYLKNKHVGIDVMGWLYSSFFNKGSLENEAYLGIMRNIELKVKVLKKFKI